MIRGHNRVLCVFCTGAMLVLPGSASAQTTPREGVRVEAMVTVGWGRLWRWDDDTRFGSGLNIGGQVVVRGESGFGFSVGWDRTVGLRSAPTIFSTNLRYYFNSTDRVQPCLIAGFGVLRIDRRGLPGSARADSVDVGFGPNLGVGLAFVDENFVAALPEVQWGDGTWRSPLNLSITRFAVGAGYSW